MGFSTKAALEGLLRERKLYADLPPLRGTDRRGRAIGSGLSAVDGVLGGGWLRGEVSEIHGPASSGRTGLALATAAQVTHGGGLVGWVDPCDRLDATAAASAGIDLPRFLWLRGRPDAPRPLGEAVAAVDTLVQSGLFDLVVFDGADATERELQRLPHTTWLRLRRSVADTPTALLVLLRSHASPGGVSLSLRSCGSRFSGAEGPSRLFRGLAAEATANRFGLRSAAFELGV